MNLVSCTGINLPAIAADHGRRRCQERTESHANAGLQPGGHRACGRGRGHGCRSLSAACRLLSGGASLRHAWAVGVLLRRKRRNMAAAVVLFLAVMALAASWHHCRWYLFGGDDLGLFAHTQQQPVCH